MTTGRINQVAIARDEASRTRPTRRHKSRRPRGHRGPDGGAVLHTGGTSPSHANHNDQRTRTRRGTHSESLDLNRKRTVLVRCSPSPEWAPLRRGCHEIAKGGPPARLTGTPVLKETSDFPPRARSGERDEGKAPAFAGHHTTFAGARQSAETRRVWPTTTHRPARCDADGQGCLGPRAERRPPDFPHAGRVPLGSGAGRSGRESGQYMR